MKGRFRRCMHGFIGTDLLIPAILAILKKEPTHGYSLLEKFSEIGLNLSFFHPSILYRTLRAMEIQGLVSSNWDVQTNGPARRVYSITKIGEDFLKNWCSTVTENIQLIQKIIDIAKGGE